MSRIRSSVPATSRESKRWRWLLIASLWLMPNAVDIGTPAVRAADTQAHDPEPSSMPWIRVSRDGKGFVTSEDPRPFVAWGVNYDHDEQGRLLEDYWHQDWARVVEDFEEIRQLRVNVVRIHLQLGRFMESPDQPRLSNLKQLRKLVELAESKRLYLNLTGLGCYHKQDVPDWYDALSESQRWQVQARFWRHVAETCRQSPAVFCYDLMNEPILPGKTAEQEWLTGELGGKFFVQRIALSLGKRTREEVARQWVAELTASIREVDSRHLITVGVIPWAHVFPKAKPLFYSESVRPKLDFVSVHFYPRQGEVDKAIQALQVYDVGMPLVVEEMFPLRCSLDEMDEFMERSRESVDGWFSFYWGLTIEENLERGDLRHAIIGKWLTRFRDRSPLK